MSATHVRAAFICPSLEVGGAERQLSILLAALREREVETRLIAIRERGPFFEDLIRDGVDARFIRVASRFDLAGVKRVVAAVGSWPNVVVTQSLDAQLVGALIAKRIRVPHVSIHHKQPEITPAAHRRLLTRLVARNIATVIAVTEAQVPDLLTSGFRRGQVKVVENGVPEPGRLREAADVRRELEVGPNEFIALFAATLRPEKRAAVFVNAVREAHRRNRRIRGIVAGGGVGLEALRKRAGDDGVVRVLGPQSQLADIIAASDVVCLTSSAEALPMVILEAMALGKPVASTAVGGIADVVVDGETGRLTTVDDGAELANVLVDLAADPDAVVALGRAARRRYERCYASDLMVEKYVRILCAQVGVAR